MVNVAVLGYGTVGSGAVEVLWQNGKEISARIGDEIHVKYVLDLRDFPGDPVEEILVHDYDIILNDPEVRIVVEVMGGIEPAYTFTKAALLAGKSVVTSNKALVAEKGAELLRIAREKHLNYLFEASVGGGIPIIRPIQSSLTAETIEEVTGILNGTTNYMMSRMFFDGVDYDEVLKDAQKRGYAEANPEADVEGYDACRKIAILTSLIAGRQVDYKKIYTEGISHLTTKDFAYAKELGMRIKLLARARRVGESFSCIVAPCLIGHGHPLFDVNGVFNAVFVQGSYVGDLMFYGQGAGKLPTASAVVGDVIDAARHLNRSIMFTWSEEELELSNHDHDARQFLVRVKGDATRYSELEAAFGTGKLVEAGVEGEIGFITPEITEGVFHKASSFVEGILGSIRLVG